MKISAFVNIFGCEYIEDIEVDDNMTESELKEEIQKYVDKIPLEQYVFIDWEKVKEE